MQVKLKGAIIELLEDFFMIKDNFTVGQKITQIEKTAKKRFYDMSDEDIYNALTTIIKTDYYTDEYTD